MTKPIKKSSDYDSQTARLLAIGQLAAGMTHELNNPVSFVMSNLSTLSDYFEDLSHLLDLHEQLASNGDTPEKAQALQKQIDAFKTAMKTDASIADIPNLLGEVNQGLTSVRDIINNLKLFSHLDEKTLDVIDITQLLDTCLSMVNGELKYKCRLHRDYQHHSSIKANANQLKQIVINLLINAGQAILERGDIFIHSFEKNDTLYIEIRDTGCGIKDEHLQKLRQPFFTTKASGVGSGLGLSICQKILEDIGGQLNIQSALGEGTTVTLALPI